MKLDGYYMFKYGKDYYKLNEDEYVVFIKEKRYRINRKYVWTYYDDKGRENIIIVYELDFQNYAVKD